MQRIEPKLYMAYNLKDKELALKLEADLRRHGIRASYDDNLIEDVSAPESSRVIRKGGDWKSGPTNELLRADCVLVLLTPNSISSRYSMSEFAMAQDTMLKSEGQKLLLPVVYGAVEIPDFIRNIQVITWRDNDGEVADQIAHAVFSFIETRGAKVANPKASKQQSQKATKEKTTSKEETVQPPEGGNEERGQEAGKGTISTEEKAPAVAANSENRNHWLLKMNPSTWKIESLGVGEKAFFHTRYNGEKRPEYHLFAKIKKGDYVLGFASGDYQTVVCEMEVMKPVGRHEDIGQLRVNVRGVDVLAKSFTMVVKRLLDPPIPLSTFRDTIAPILPRLEQNNTSPPELFFELSETEYTTILSSGSSQDETIEKAFQPFFLTEGNHSATRDQLDFENDYNSFASVIALKRVNPPLAIGLFGNWGSGKSFFMEKLSEQIDKLAESKDPEYVEHVVPVKFNSWHYSDTNLWASLTTQIFESLNDYAQKKAYGPEAIEAIYRDLNITGRQLEETKKQLAANEARANVLRQQKNDKEETIRQKKETLDLWQARDFVRLVFSDPYIQEDFRDIKEQFKDEKLINDLGEIEKTYTEIDSTADRVVKAFALLKDSSKGKWRWIWILAVLFGIAGWLALGPLREVVERVVSGATVITGLCVTWLVNIIARLSPYFSKVNQFYKRLKSLKETVEKEKEKVHLKEHDEVERLQRDIEGLTQEQTDLELEQRLTEEKKETLQNEIRDIGSGKLLANFLAGRSADDAYIKQLGIMSWIRKDFSKLNDLFQNQNIVRARENAGTPAVQIDRIVLYIDDLDRCNEDVVVKVLEAIHLLLAFPLFVVVVGVDPRWLNNALSEKYKSLFGSRTSKNNEMETSATQSHEQDIGLDRVATSYDYLEKIFQIPFALKPINRTGREKLIQYLIKDEMAGTTSTVNKPAGSSPSLQDVIIKEGTTIRPVTPHTEVEEKKTHSTGEITQVARKVRERLVFTDAELTYMQRISPLFGQTPRTINRYVNIYRIIKAHGNLKVVGAFSEDEFKPVMFILGVIVGHSAFAEEFIVRISETEDNIPFRDFLKGQKLDKKLVALIEPLASDIAAMPMENFKRNRELISRFSFRTLLK